LDYRTMQYLYNDGDSYYFMDEETFEQTPINASQNAQVNIKSL
ncbi:unnamed protein product, partial [marine sediment metagenome]